METSASLVRIVVLTRPEGRESSRDTLNALTQLGSDVEIEIVRDAQSCLAAVQAARVDAVLVDRASEPTSTPVLEALAHSGPPVVFVTDDPGETAALDAFRAGAADCVRVGPNYADVLPVVVLEQLRRWRKQEADGVAERRIRELQRYNDDIVRNINSALLVVDRHGRIQTANTTAEEILLESLSGLEGQLVWDWFVGAADEESPIARTLAEGVRYKGAEAQLRRSDGTLIPIGLSCSPLEMEGRSSEDRGAVVIFQDLSEIRLLQRQVLQTEKMASIGQLAAGIAHEINNPMGFIHANLFQMSEYLGDLRQAWERVEDLQKAADDLGPATGTASPAQAEGREALRQAADALAAIVRDLDLDFVHTDFAKAVRESQDGAERIRNIVKDLRDFSHTGGEDPCLADLNECLDSTASIAWTMMKHSVVLEKDYAELPQVRCWPAQLKQVFMNLLVNAYQAIEEKLGGAGGTAEIRLRTAAIGSFVTIQVADAGIGIDATDLNRIFDPFFTTKDVGVGMGLGLANSYNIVERHEGRIDVESQPGEGTTFTVTLPVAGPSATSRPEAAETDG